MASIRTIAPASFTRMLGGSTLRAPYVRVSYQARGQVPLPVEDRSAKSSRQIVCPLNPRRLGLPRQEPGIGCGNDVKNRIAKIAEFRHIGAVQHRVDARVSEMPLSPCFDNRIKQAQINHKKITGTK